MILFDKMVKVVLIMSTKDRIEALKAKITAIRPVSVAHQSRSVNRYSQMKHGVRRYANYKRTN